MKNYKLLIINPGSTSDEVAFFNGDNKVFHEVVRYETKQMEPYEGKKITEQFDFRKQFVLSVLKENGIDTGAIDAVVARGGLLKPIEGGVYKVNEQILMELREERQGSHPSNLGAIIADSIARELGKDAFISDPVTVDEMMEIARYSGMVENPRISIFHCLNQRRVAYLVAKKINKDYKNTRFIVAHLGGGISVGAHLNGRIIDVNNALDGEGPFTPQRSGGVPSGGFAKLCFSGKYTFADVKLMIKGKGGMVAYTGTADLKILEKYASGETLSEEEKNQINSDISPEKAKILIESMSYHISKEICSLGAVFEGKLDGIILSGGLAYSEMIMGYIKKRVGWLAEVFIIPGGDEIRALKNACERVLNGEEEYKEYK